MLKTSRLCLLLVLCLLPVSGFSYGPRGHALVGAIADLRLSLDKSAAAKVAKLLDGITLAQAATMPNSIKGWDECNRAGGTFTVAGGARINAELRAFVRAN